jgi:galactarate dehydratase
MGLEMGRDTSTKPEAPRVIRMHPADNVAIVVNDFGAPAGAKLLSGPTLHEYVPQGHKVALVDIAHGAPVRRYNVVIGYAAQALPAGSWVNEQRLLMPTPPALEGLPIATNNAPLAPALEGYTFEGYRNPDGSVGTRNILAITTTVQCVSGVVEHAVGRIRAELLPRYPNVDDVVGLEHIYGCGVAIEAAEAEIPIRTLRNISLNANFGGGTMVVSLGCEKLQPERLLPAGTMRARGAAGLLDYDLVTLQDPSHVGLTP